MEENKVIREEVLQSVGGLSDEQLNERLQADSWTIMQVLEHLYLMELSIVQTISDQLANGESKTVADKPIHLTTNRKTKVDAPPFAIPSNNFITLEEIKDKLAESRETLLGVVDSVDQTLLEQRTFVHPGFGELSLKQWVPFVGLHEKRHLAQIEELKANFG